MDLDHALARLQTAIEQWQTVYAPSPNVCLRQQVAALQEAVQHLRTQRANQPAGYVVANTVVSVAPTQTERPAPLLGKMLGSTPLLPKDTCAGNDAAVRKTYRQRYIKCGKASCSTCADGPGHGPYWYAYWRDGLKVRSTYIGKQRPPP